MTSGTPDSLELHDMLPLTSQDVMRPFWSIMQLTSSSMLKKISFRRYLTTPLRQGTFVSMPEGRPLPTLSSVLNSRFISVVFGIIPINWFTSVVNGKPPSTFKGRVGRGLGLQGFVLWES